MAPNEVTTVPMIRSRAPNLFVTGLNSLCQMKPRWKTLIAGHAPSATRHTIAATSRTPTREAPAVSPYRSQSPRRSPRRRVRRRPSGRGTEAASTREAFQSRGACAGESPLRHTTFTSCVPRGSPPHEDFSDGNHGFFPSRCTCDDLSERQPRPAPTDPPRHGLRHRRPDRRLRQGGCDQGRLARHLPKRDHRDHRAVRLRQVDLPALPQSDERPRAERQGRRARSLPRHRPVRGGRRPDRDLGDRGPDARTEARLHARDRDAQHAAGCARRRDDGVLQPECRGGRLPPRSARRVRLDREDLHATLRRAHRGLRHGTVRLVRLSFTEELAQLEAAVQEEGDLVLRALRSALNALARGDDELADEVIRFDDEIDRRYVAIEEGVQSLLARQTPVAADLRLVLAVLRVNLHLERMADYCVTVAKLTKLMGGLDVHDERIQRSIEDMGQRAEQMIRVALDTFAARDADKAQTLVDLDELIDRANRNATEDVLSLGDSPQEREYGLRMLVVSRCVERIGDHAVDIGEQVFFLVTGEIREFTDASHPMDDF